MWGDVAIPVGDIRAVLAGGYRLVLVGIGIDAAATALTDWLLVITRVQDATRATVCRTGSLNGTGGTRWRRSRPC